MPSVTRVIYTAHLGVMQCCEKTLAEKFDLEATGSLVVLALQKVVEGRILVGKGHGEILWVLLWRVRERTLYETHA
jgi:hypothetical protein